VKLRRLALALAALGLSGCVSLASFREPFVAPGRAMQVAWRRQLTDQQIFGGSKVFMRDGKEQKFSTGIDIDYKPQEFAAAASDGRRVFVGSSQGVLWALTADDGRLLWRRPLSGPISSEPAYIAELNLVLVGDDDGALWALDPATGAQRWVYRSHGPITARPIYGDGIVYFTNAENRIYAIDAVRGTWKWQYDRESPDGFTIRGQGGPLLWGGKVYAGFSDGYLACLEARTGDIVWVRQLNAEVATTHYVDVDATPVVYKGTLYVSSVAGGVFALDPKDGSVRWRYEVENAGSVRVRNGRVYFSAGKQGVYCLDVAGRLVWHQALPQAGELSTPLVVAGWVVVSAADSGTYIANADNGRLDVFLMPGHGITGPPTTDGRHVFVVSNAGFVYALSINRPRS
jgi:outer membrane protein assembly factor BamB